MLQNPYESLSDDAVHQGLLGLAKRERELGADIILHLLLVKERKLYAAWGHDSVFTYCTERLGFSRSTAYRRKTVMEKVSDFPSLLERLKDGRLLLCAAAAVAPHLTAQNADELLDAVAKLSHREVEAFLVRRRATALKAGQEAILRAAELGAGQGAGPGTAALRLGQETGGGQVLNATSPLFPAESADNHEHAVLAAETAKPAIPESAQLAPPLPLPRTIIKPLTEHASRVNVTVTESTLALLVRAKELLAGKPDDEVLRRALSALLDDIAPERRHARRIRSQERSAAKVKSPSSRFPAKPAPTSQKTDSRRGKLADRDAAAVAGGGRCTFVGPDNHQCTARAFIQIDHAIPYSKGGQSQRWNFAPLCWTHNAFKGAKMPSTLPHPESPPLP